MQILQKTREVGNEVTHQPREGRAVPLIVTRREWVRSIAEYVYKVRHRDTNDVYPGGSRFIDGERFFEGWELQDKSGGGQMDQFCCLVS